MLLMWFLSLLLMVFGGTSLLRPMTILMPFGRLYGTMLKITVADPTLRKTIEDPTQWNLGRGRLQVVVVGVGAFMFGLLLNLLVCLVAIGAIVPN